MLADQQQMNVTFPIYFGNVCLRFIPVFDIVVHRLIISYYEYKERTLYQPFLFFH